MNPLRQHRGVAVPLLRINIDTDAIIPSREMKRVSKKGLGKGLFAGWRYRYRGDEKCGDNPDFVLNQQPYAGASILLAGANFGCGSSREHAVWALAEFGFRVLIAPSFGSIFRSNCIRNGLLPIVLPAERVETLAGSIHPDPQRRKILVDLETCSIESPDGQTHDFDIDAASRKTLLEGLDPIEVTLQLAEAIGAFKAEDRKRRPWARLRAAEKSG